MGIKKCLTIAQVAKRLKVNLYQKHCENDELIYMNSHYYCYCCCDNEHYEL